MEEWKEMDLSRRNDEVLYGKVEFSIEILISVILNEAVYVVFAKISGPFNLMTQHSYSPVSRVLVLILCHLEIQPHKKNWKFYVFLCVQFLLKF